MTEDTGPGTKIGPYRLHEELGEGGMGLVYRATQTEPVKREVALKLIKLGMDTKEVVARFESERQALAVMDHACIARVFDAGATDSGRPYFVMELVRGVPITQYCDTHKLSTTDRLILFIRVCDAVQHAHQKGVVHRDLKPSNVLVTVEDARPMPKVIDFGIAKAVGSSLTDKTLATSIGQILGTPAYMSPEQAERTGLDVDTRTDLYALGVMLYELLSGTLPFDRDALSRPDFVIQYLLRERDVPTPSARLSSLADTQQTVARNRLTSVATLRRELRGDLDWIVMKAMEKDRNRRYGSASELGAEIQRYLDGVPVVARPPSTSYRLGKFARRNRGAIAAGVTLVASLVVGATVSTVGFVRADRNAGLAADAAARAEAVSGFLDQMLRAADPVGGGGAGTTVKELLDVASEEVAEGALAGQPLVEVAVRRSIGGTYMGLGLYEPAREHLDVALALLESTPGGSDLERMTVLDDLGQLHRRMDEAEAAEARYRHALALADSAGLLEDGGPGEGMANRVRNDLGLVLRTLDRIDEAAVIFEALAESERRLLEPDDVDLATTLNNLALIKRAQGDTEGAIALFGEALSVLRAAFGESHIYVAAVLESIGSLEQRSGDYQTADSLMTEAMAMRREILGERHPDIVNGFNGLGLLHIDMDELNAAQVYLEEGLAMSREVLGEEHTRTASLHNSLGILHTRRNDPLAAEGAFRSAVAIRDEVLGPRHRLTLNSNAQLAGALVLGDKAAEGETLAGYVVGAQESIGLVDPMLVGAAKRTWGQALVALGRFAEAERELLAAYELQESGLGSTHAQTQGDVEALVELYGEWGRDADAEVWRARGVDR